MGRGDGPHGVFWAEGYPSKLLSRLSLQRRSYVTRRGARPALTTGVLCRCIASSLSSHSDDRCAVQVHRLTALLPLPVPVPVLGRL